LYLDFKVHPEIYNLKNYLFIQIALILACGNPLMSGDGYCDDVNNNAGCDFDGGDCCGDNVDKRYCSKCICYENDFFLLDARSLSDKEIPKKTFFISLKNEGKVSFERAKELCRYTCRTIQDFLCRQNMRLKIFKVERVFLSGFHGSHPNKFSKKFHR
jgi:hypothetical protein